MSISEINIPIGNYTSLKASLSVPDSALSLVIFSHGSGSSRFSVRNRLVATELNKNKIATLLADLLTEEEYSVFENRFNIPLLSERLISVTSHINALPRLKKLPIGFFGASTGAASALTAAAQLDGFIHAVVSRGGRPDLAISALHKVEAPVLLIVGSKDTTVLDYNKNCLKKFHCPNKLEIIEGASHLFEEPGKLQVAAALAAGWFNKYINAQKIKIHVV